MATYIEYELEDGTTLLVESSEPQVGGVVRASRDAEGNIIKRASQTFEAALAKIKPWAAALRDQLDSVEADEVEVTFGIKAVGEAGNFAVGKVGAEANYEVTLKWVAKEGK
jgi:hypothetical protein